MGIFSRISDIINSNINAILDKAEDPEKMVKLMITEMEDTLIEIKSSAAGVVAENMRLKRQIHNLQGKVSDWGAKAELAVEKGRDDLAKAAIEQKRDAEEQLELAQKRLGESIEIAKQYQNDIARLEEKLASAKARQKSIIAQHQRAHNRRKVEEQLYKANTTSAFARFESYEHRIDRLNAEAEVMHQSNQNLDKEFRDLMNDNSLEDELSKLKAKVKGSKQAQDKPVGAKS